MKNSEKTLTSVRLQPRLWNTYKDVCKDEKFTFQKLAERSIYLYLTDHEFRNKIRNQQNTELQ